MDKDCPECGLKLSLKQISHTKAVYLCAGQNCKYPKDAVFTIVNRHYTEIAAPKKRDDIDDFVHEILDGWDLGDAGPSGELATNSNNANHLPQVETKPIKSESSKDNVNNCEPLDEENISVEVVKREVHDDEANINIFEPLGENMPVEVVNREVHDAAANKWNDFKFTSFVIKPGNVK